MRDRFDGTSGQVPLRARHRHGAATRNLRLTSRPRLEGSVTFFSPKRIRGMRDRFDGTSGHAPLRARPRRRAGARSLTLVPRSTLEGSVTFFSPKRTGGMRDRFDGPSGKLPLRASRQRPASARNVRLMSQSRMEGVVTFFLLKRLSRYAGQVGFTRHTGQGAASRAAPASSSYAQREARVAVDDGGSCDLFRAETSK